MDINNLKQYVNEQYSGLLTDEEKRALRIYSLIGSNINKTLRRHYTKNKYLESIELIDSALEKFSCVNDLVLYRKLYLYNDEKKVLLRRWLNTNVIIDKGYLSTTLDKESYDRDYNVLITIDYPKHKTGAYIKPFSQYKKEEEFLIKRGSVLFIEDAEFDEFNNIHIIKTKLK